MRARHALAAAAVLTLAAACAGSLSRLQRFRKECFPAIPCVMILDAKGSYGCGQCTEDSISEEVSEIVQGAALTNFLGAGSVRRFLLIPQITFFRSQFLNTLQFKFESIAGMIVYDDFPVNVDQLDADENQEVLDVSTDRQNPNDEYSLPLEPPMDPPFKYNNLSSGMAQFRFYPFNIFRVNATVAARIRERVQKFATNQRENQTANTDILTGAAADSNRGGMSPTYVLQSNGRMYACPENLAKQAEELEENTSQDSADSEAGYVLKNSKQCLEDLTCFPIGGQSVWSALGRLQAPVTSVLAITAPMDSTAFFHGVAQGAAAEVSSLATLMAVAEAVGEWRRGPGKDAVMLRQPVYFAWNAQSWGFAGSSRFLKDVLEFECSERHDDAKKQGCKAPYKSSLKFKDFKGVNWAVLNINSIITPARIISEEPVTADDSVPSFYMHGNDTEDSPETVLIRDTLSDVFGPTIRDADIPYRPPDASQSFAQLLPGVEAVSIANFESTFRNRAYHEEFDNVSRIPQSRRQPLYTAADGLAKAIIKMCFGVVPETLEVKSETIDGFIQCFTSNWSAVDCELSRVYQGDIAFKQGQQAVRSGNYAGVFVPEPREDLNPSQSYKTGLVRKFLMYQNRIDEGGDCLRTNDPSKTNDFDESACVEYSEQLNQAAVADKNESAFVPVECVRQKCIASDTYRHDAYGTGISPTDRFGAERTSENLGDPQFNVNSDDESEENNRGYEVPQFTESHWDPELGVCGLTEDSSLFGYSILFGGVGINVVSLIVAWLLNSCLKDKDDKEDDDLEEERIPIAV